MQPPPKRGAQAETPSRHGPRDTSCQPPARATPSGSRTGVYQPAQTELGTTGSGLSQQSPRSLPVVFDSLTPPSRRGSGVDANQHSQRRAGWQQWQHSWCPARPLSFPLLTGGAGKGKAGQGTRSKLALHGGFPPGAVAGSALMPDTSAQAGWLRSLGEQAESPVPAQLRKGHIRDTGTPLQPILH